MIGMTQLPCYAAERKKLTGAPLYGASVWSALLGAATLNGCAGSKKERDR
jgi:hypothetical protein